METPSLKNLFLLFLKLGMIGFGGPAAHIAMMHTEIVVRRKWLSDAQFTDMIGATQLIPGPNSTELAIHIGHKLHQWRGLLVAGFSFIIPAVLISGILAACYAQFADYAILKQLFSYAQPAIILIILKSILPLLKAQLNNIQLIILASVSLLLMFLFPYEIIILFGFSLIYALINVVKKQNTVLLFLPFQIPVFIKHEGFFNEKNIAIFLSFLKIGSILYGSGYVLFAFLEAEFVPNGMINLKQLNDAIAIGQLTPGPVFSSVTFLGYLMNGWQGALIATIGVFLPSFIFVAILDPILNFTKKSLFFKLFLKAVNVISLVFILKMVFSMFQEITWNTTTLFQFILLGILIYIKPSLNLIVLLFLSILIGFIFSYLT